MRSISVGACASVLLSITSNRALTRFSIASTIIVLPPFPLFRALLFRAKSRTTNPVFQEVAAVCRGVTPSRFLFSRRARRRTRHFARGHPTITNLQNPLETSRKLNILLTEDNLVNRVLAQKLLQKFGHSVTLANNGKEGATLWEANQASQFDVILMDIQMPLMDGLQATAYIRAKEKKQSLASESSPELVTPVHIPIVAMTAHAMKGDRERYLAGGMDGYVSKPINSAELERVIQSVVDQFPSRSRVIAAPATKIQGAPNPDVTDTAGPGIAEAEILARFDGDVELVRELAGMFLDECPKYLGDIREAINSGNAKGLEHSAHTLKGSVGNFSTKDAHASALQLEILGRLGSIDGAAEILQKLEEQLERFNRILGNMAKETVHRAQ
jgi:two-component system, sensor histidine kinase and response regulator